MKSYSLKHLKDQPLLDGLDNSFLQCYANAAMRLAHIAEVDARQLYRQAGYPSMSAYCMGRFRVSKESAYKLVRAAQLAYEHPVLFEAVADGRLHTRGIVLLGPRLSPKTVDELLAMATHKTCDEIVLLLAERYPRPDLPASIQLVVPETAASPM